jgi:ABC-type phosphate transport system substrate-binding protein
VFIGTTGNLANNACGDYTTSNKNGFSGVAAEPNFAASDAPMSGSEYSTFITNKHVAHTEPVQVPSIAGAIAVVYNQAGQSGTLNLTESQICQIFSGAINDWHQLNSAIASPAPITLVYRSDSSGTSFNFSNHLSYVCPTAVPNAVTGFSTQSTFAGAFPGGTPVTGSQTGSGNGGVVSQVQAIAGSIGYAEVEDAILRGNFTTNNAVKFASVSIQPDTKITNGHPGVTYHKWLPTSMANRFTIPAGGILTDQVITTNNSAGRPQVDTITNAAGAPPPQSGCMYLADPNAIATAPTKQYTKTSATTGLSTTYNEYKSYPIVAVTYLLAYNTGNGDDTNNMKSLMTMAYSGSGANNYNGVSRVGLNAATGNVGTGFAYLTGLPTGFPNLVKACIKG